MQEPAQPAPPKAGNKRPLSDAEFFGVAALKKEVVKQDQQDRPDWYHEWLSNGGLTRDFVLWYDSKLAYQIFMMCQFQWLHGFNGITGMNFAAVIPVIALHARRTIDQLALLEDIHWLELGAMTAFAEQRRLADEKAEAERKK